MNIVVHYCGSILLAVLLLAGCKKDAAPPTSNARIATIEESGNPLSSTFPAPIARYTFTYDQQGRVTAVNDKQFTYGSNGKVSASLIRRNNVMGDRAFHYTEKFRYEWDNEGRITAMVADSIYHHQYTVAGGVATTTAEYFRGNVVIAKYTYNGNGKLPAQIDYLKNYDVLGQTGGQEVAKIEADGDKVTYINQLTQPALPTNPGVPPGGAYTFGIYSWYKYSNRQHFLYNAFKQLGFHPYTIGAVVSANDVSDVYHVVTTIGAAPRQPDWTKADKLTYEYGSTGLATKVKATFLTTAITYE